MTDPPERLRVAGGISLGNCVRLELYVIFVSWNPLIGIKYIVYRA